MRSERIAASRSEAMDAMREGNCYDLQARIIGWAREIRAWEIEWRTGIYPCEMAAFIGLCDSFGIRSIVESGRGEDAYSTQVLGEYAERTRVKIVSIDFGPTQGKAFQQRLEHYHNLRCVVGDTFDVLPHAMVGMPGPIAILLDGPKLQPANRLSLAASIMWEIRIVAHHNCPSLSPWGKEFGKVFPGAFHYEQLGLVDVPEWQEFKRWEKEWVKSYELYDEAHGIPGRSLGASSLAMAVLAPEQRQKARVLELQSGHPRYNPLWLWLKWSWSRDRSAKS